MHKQKKVLAIALVLGLLFSFYTWIRFSKEERKVYRLSIVAAHNNEIKELVIPFLQKKCKERYGADLEIEWVKYGGQNANIKVINASFKKNRDATCGYDVIWGGGEAIFYKLHDEKRLTTFHLSPELEKSIPPTLAGVRLYNKDPRERTWIAVYMSTFGIIYNKVLLQGHKLRVPAVWEDLAREEFFGKVVGVDPTQSSSMGTIHAVILQVHGWSKGWEILTKMSANVTAFLEKGSSSAMSVAHRNAILSMTIAYYAQELISELGEDQVGFVLPIRENVINTDPIAILKGAPHPEMAAFCIETILSKEFQMLCILKKDSLHGPTSCTLGRIGVNKSAYEAAQPNSIASVLNPFQIKEHPIKLEINSFKRRYPVLSALFKATCISPHAKLREAWWYVIQHGSLPEDVALLTRCPLNEDQLSEVIEKWNDPLWRKEKIIAWENEALNRYQQIINKYAK